MVLTLCFSIFFFVQKQQTVLSGATENEPAGYHTAMYYFDNADFFPASVESFKNTKPLNPAPRVFIVNQHVLAAHLIAQQFALAADDTVKTVVVITQNNWNAGTADAITSNYGWKTTLGDIKPSTNIAEDLVKNNLAAIDESIFSKEHGITGVIPYVAHAFPNAKVVPIVIRDGTSNTITDGIAAELSKLDLKNTVIVGTIDMSHYLPKYIADAHDRLTVESIKSFNYDVLPRLDIDTAPTLRTIMKVAETTGQKNFIQTGGVNSAEIVNDPDLLVTTSYVTGYFSKNMVKEDDKFANVNTKSAHMLFVGDIMLDRGVAIHAKKYGVNSLFSKLERLFLGTHAVIGNLEGTMTNEPSVAIPNGSILHFTFDPSFAGVLKKLKFSAFSMANNHALDFGKSGYDETVKNLDAKNFVSFGSPLNNQRLSGEMMVNGKKVCLVGYHDLFTHDEMPAINEIKKLDTDGCPYIVLFAHWGDEYESKQNSRQEPLAHEFIDAGADLVIGAHPHVVQPIEIYKNKAIFYSLGNFMFDQEFSWEVKHGMAVNVELRDDKTLFTLVPVTINRAEVEISNTEEAAKTLKTAVNSPSLLGNMATDILTKKQFILWNNQTQTESSQNR